MFAPPMGMVDLIDYHPLVPLSKDPLHHIVERDRSHSGMVSAQVQEGIAGSGKGIQEKGRLTYAP